MLLYQKTWICIHRKSTGQTALPPLQKVGEGGRFSSLCHRFFFFFEHLGKNSQWWRQWRKVIDITWGAALLLLIQKAIKPTWLVKCLRACVRSCLLVKHLRIDWSVNTAAILSAVWDQDNTILQTTGEEAVRNVGIFALHAPSARFKRSHSPSIPTELRLLLLLQTSCVLFPGIHGLWPQNSKWKIFVQPDSATATAVFPQPFPPVSATVVNIQATPESHFAENTMWSGVDTCEAVPDSLGASFWRVIKRRPAAVLHEQRQIAVAAVTSIGSWNLSFVSPPFGQLNHHLKKALRSMIPNRLQSLTFCIGAPRGC